MEGGLILLAMLGVVYGGRYWLRSYLAANHPKVKKAWDDSNARREERRRKIAAGSVKVGFGIAKMLMKK